MALSFRPFASGKVPRLWLFAGAACVAGAVAWWQLGSPKLPTQDRSSRTQRASVQSEKVETELTERQLEAVKIAQVGRANFIVQRQAVGSIDFNQNMLVQVFTTNAGRILSTFANVGDRVERGQVLFTVESPDLLTAESNLIQNAGTLVLQTANLKRVRENLRGGGGAQKDVDQASSDQQTAEGNYRAARDAVRVFGKTDEEIDAIVKERRTDPALIIRSPITGLVTQRTAAPGLLVQPGNAPAPFTVADMSTLWMVANAVEGDAPLLRVGQPVRARVTAYPDRAFDGQITIVGPQVDLTTRRFFVRSEIKDPEGLLRPGMFGSFTIDIGTPQPSLAVPTAAVVREGDGSMSVWQTDGSRRFERRIVKIGLQQNGMTQILEGLSAGDSVVTEGAVYVSNKAFGGSTGD